ncbi:hypothetical protein [Pseudacidovorax sp. RU35E]|uniref:hypothetical protein n=1 Tax=Pseudacidovorax sp. RU35E TaxID=1907403 RepID=UPI000956CD3F|nr:hypothetical protein [Pseudacidovorax sp. RU35E]SIQ99453.1 hypothetical protein SAMN05880557_10765 [Pseudacidovorax sp. RU35E]
MTAAMQALLVALAISVAGNAGMGWAWLQARTAATELRGQRDEARGDASACSDATQDLRDLADQRAAAAKKDQAAAAAKARAHQALAQTILSTPPAVPGDACASAQARVDAWLRGRAAP